MSFFGKILEKLGIKKEEKPAAAPAVDKGEKDNAPAKPAVAKPVAAAPAAKPAAPAADLGREEDKADTSKAAAAPAANFGREEDLADSSAGAAAKAAEPKVAAISEVDVTAKLEQMASGSGLNWKVSIVDMLKVLGMDSSLDARKELATELGCPADLMGGDHSKMNVWLHKEVLRQIAQNGGNIPKELLD